VTMSPTSSTYSSTCISFQKININIYLSTFQRLCRHQENGVVCIATCQCLGGTNRTVFSDKSIIQCYIQYLCVVRSYMQPKGGEATHVVFTQNIHAQTRARAQTHAYTRTYTRARTNAHTHVHTHVLSHTRKHTHTHSRSHAHACTLTRMYSHTHTHTHTHAHTHTHIYI
jgi:hypothetical protein